ncbi:MAG: hypothetical protein ACKN9T_09520 [Candidatus Methylumidiphilus sp.]
MKTVLLEIDEAIYAQVLGFLRLLPEQQCHVIETAQAPEIAQLPLNIASSFGMIKTPITADLATLEAGIMAGAISDSD